MSIGIIDSGIGGLTLLPQLGQFLQADRIVYYGDNANCPYGNKPKDEIMRLSLSMLAFMKGENVTAVAIACNTISALAEELRKTYSFPIISIVEEACENVASLKLESVGLLATEFTVKQRIYESILGRLCPETKVYGLASSTLAELIDSGGPDSPEVALEVKELTSRLLSERPRLKHIILGCTHYPFALTQFEAAAPGVTFINPAFAQASAIKANLVKEKNVFGLYHKPLLQIYTSGSPGRYTTALRSLGYDGPCEIHGI